MKQLLTNNDKHLLSDYYVPNLVLNSLFPIKPMSYELTV